MEVYIPGKGKEKLGEAEFAGQGAEGAVYVKGDRAFKIFNDPAKMIPPGKIQELAVLDRPNILRPLEVLLDHRNRPVGYQMPRSQGATTLCQLFNPAFRDRKGVTHETIQKLVRKLRDGVEFVHGHGILLVDLNEMNFLVDLNLSAVLFIDVDSYQTPSFPATALMETVRDRHSFGFSVDSDWFSFAVVSFQLFVGIHPYRGHHPEIPDLEARMQKNISVFNPRVTLPRVCYPFSVIPQAYRDWFRAVFEDGKRCPPPQEFQGLIHTTPSAAPAAASGGLVMEEVYRFPETIVQPVFAGPDYAALTPSGFYVGSRRVLEGQDLRVGITPQGQVTVASIREGRLELFNATTGRALNVAVAATGVLSCQDRLYIQSVGAIHELTFLELPGGVQVALRRAGNVLENAARLLDGVVLQSLLGAWYAILFPKPGAAITIRLSELDGYQVLDARFDNRVLMVLVVRGGEYSRFIFRFDSRCERHDSRVVEGITPLGLNFVTLDSGVSVSLNENEELELFENHPDSADTRLVREPAVAGGRLFRHHTAVYLARGERLYRLQMKGK